MKRRDFLTKLLMVPPALLAIKALPKQQPAPAIELPEEEPESMPDWNNVPDNTGSSGSSLTVISSGSAMPVMGVDYGYNDYVNYVVRAHGVPFSYLSVEPRSVRDEQGEMLSLGDRMDIEMGERLGKVLQAEWGSLKGVTWRHSSG